MVASLCFKLWVSGAFWTKVLLICQGNPLSIKYVKIETIQLHCILQLTVEALLHNFGLHKENAGFQRVPQGQGDLALC